MAIRMCSRQHPIGRPSIVSCSHFCVNLPLIRTSSVVICGRVEHLSATMSSSTSSAVAGAFAAATAAPKPSVSNEADSPSQRQAAGSAAWASRLNKSSPNPWRTVLQQQQRRRRCTLMLTPAPGSYLDYARVLDRKFTIDRAVPLPEEDLCPRSSSESVDNEPRKTHLPVSGGTVKLCVNIWLLSDSVRSLTYLGSQ